MLEEAIKGINILSLLRSESSTFIYYITNQQQIQLSKKVTSYYIIRAISKLKL